MTNKPEILCWLSDARGQYIPRDFANSFADRAKAVKGVSADQWEILEAGPDHEFYWDVWTEVCDSAQIFDGSTEYRIHQDGDCWLVPVGMEWNHENEMYEWPADEELLWFTSSSGRIEIQMTLEQAQSASHQGKCDEDVEALAKEPAIKAQLDAIDATTLRGELQEYGSWDETELSDHDQNLQRILWLAAGDIVEESNQAVG
jgi:hypothetical protein